MYAEITLELLEPVVARLITAKIVSKSLSRSLGREARIEFEPIEGERKKFLAVRGRKKIVEAILPGKATFEAEVDPYIVLELRRSKLYRRLCHETSIEMKRRFRRFKIPDCGYVNLLLGSLTAPRPRFRRDSRGFRRTFGRSRISISPKE